MNAVRVIVAVALCLPLAARADDGATDPPAAAITSATPIVNLRLRSETVGQDGFADEAHAVTLRARLGFQTGEAWNTSLLAEGDFNRPLDGRYDSTTNHRLGYPIVADPTNTALNRLELVNTALPDTNVTLGRQRINLDDQRFVGSVGFRQNEQTFDSLRVANHAIRNLTLDVTYLDRVNRVFGRDSPVGHFTGSSYLAHAAYRTPIGELTGFGYWLAFHQDLADSSRTVGARFRGGRKWDRWTLRYAAAYAHQDPYGENPLHFAADYYAGAVTLGRGGASLGGGIEVMGGDGVKGFTTPLATLHKFDGWADVFLTTPVNGVEDRYASLGYSVARFVALDRLTVTAIYHDFRAARLGLHYGTEGDLQVLGRWHRVTGIVAFADYARDRFASDTRKLWLEIDYSLNDE